MFRYYACHDGGSQSTIFIPGEYELAATTVQLRKMGYKTDNRKIYEANGTIRLGELECPEVLVLETDDAFNHDDPTKTVFDISKGMFALLAMLKTIADKYNHASVNEFRRLKLYFVQPSDTSIRLWLMQYAKHGLYNFAREKKVLLGEDFEGRDGHMAPLIDFFLALKDFHQETIKTLTALKSQHEKKEKRYDSENDSQVVLLSDTICPKNFKLSYNMHGQHLSKGHCASSPGSEY